MRFIFIELLVVASYGTYFANAYPNGAPKEACGTLTPRHASHTPQLSEVPYVIDLDQFEDNGSYVYIPEKTYTLTLWDPSGSAGDYFEGFFVQSRLVADDKTLVGAFGVDDPNSRLVNCGTDTDGITQKQEEHFTSMTMKWIAPAVGTGPVHFAYAVVEDFDVFWANQRSEMLLEGEAEESSGEVEDASSGLTMSILSLLLSGVMALLLL